MTESEMLIQIIFNVIITFSILIGSFFMFSATIGIIRFPDVYTKLHAATKATTLGIAGILVGGFIFLYVHHDIISGKLILAILFMFITNPVSAHMISRAAHNKGIKPVLKNRQDAYDQYKSKLTSK